MEKDIEEILASRFIEGDYFEKTLKNLHDPYLLADMKQAVDKIKEIVENKGRIIIFLRLWCRWCYFYIYTYAFFQKNRSSSEL